jgi:hypothetical protein
MISKKKLTEFKNIFKLYDSNNIILEIELLKKMFDSDFFNNILDYINYLVNDITQNQKHIFLHININSLSIADLYNYDKILEIAQILHNYAGQIHSIFIYGNTSICLKIISMISNSLGYNINNKIIFLSIEEFNSKFIYY